MHVCSNQHWKIVLVLSFFVHCWKIVKQSRHEHVLFLPCLWSSDFVAFFYGYSWIVNDLGWRFGMWVQCPLISWNICMILYVIDIYFLSKYSTKVVKRITIINKHNPLAWFDVISLKSNTFDFSVGMVPCLLQSLCWS